MIFAADKDSFKELLREVLQEVLEREITEAVGAKKRKESQGGWDIARAMTAAPW